MQIPIYEVVVGESLPDLGLFVTRDGSLLTGLDSGHTFSMAVRNPADTSTLFTKTTGFTGQTGSGKPPSGTPNLVVQWATSGELDQLTVDEEHKSLLVITRTSDSRKHKRRLVLRAIEDPTL